MTAKMLFRGLAVMAMAFSRGADCLASTDTITWGGDNSRSGYFPNNNMDPAVVMSSEFGQVFKVQLPGNYNGEKERIFSQPLIYTPKNGDGTQYVYWATAQNNVYKMNAKTGEILASRNLHIPFMSNDLNGENQQTPGYCQDINPVVGIIGTGVIDPDTDTLYLSSKTYADQTLIGIPQGRPAGRIFIHALNVNDLTERPNFPINLEGLSPRNNPARTFNGGIQNQRPGLLHPKGSDFIYAGFGSHCVNYNFTGYIVGWHKTTGEIVERYATQGEGVDSPKKGASIWMSGGGIASDDKGSIFFSTGNGYSGQVNDIPISGRTPPTSLEEAVVHMTYNSSGSTSVVDFFMPANKGYLDGGDLDLGTSPVAILPSDPFSCGDIKRMGVITGKDHNTWFLNLDDLGGYKTAADRGNRVIGSYYNENSVYAGVGVYPLDGGYVYVNVIGFKSHVFKFNCVNGVPAFSKVADSPAGKNGFGVSHGAVTSLKGQPGTGLFWVTDVDDAVPEKWTFRIYEAVPTGAAGTVMRLLKGFAVSAINKFTRPQFGDGIVYFGTSQGLVYGFGAPTNPALSCTVGTDFGTVNIGVQAPEKIITCTAKIALTVTAFTIESTEFTTAELPTLPRTMAAQTSFSFKANFKPSKVGVLSGNVVIRTTNNVGGYATITSVRLAGTGDSSSALLTLSPASVTFSQLVVGADPISNTVLLANEGKTGLTIESIEFSEGSETGPFVPADVVGGEATVGLFTLTNLPSTLAALSQQLVSISFDPATVGDFTLYAKFTSDGGSVVIAIKASVGQSPVALLQLEKPDGTGWQTWDPATNAALSFGNVTQNKNLRLRFRITNVAPAGSVALQIPISKPPFGVPGLINTVNQADLGEGSVILPGEFLEAVIVCTAPKTQWNTDPFTNVAGWVFNTNDATLGKFEVAFTCTAVAQQAGPLKDDGQGKYRYAGCFRENTPGRQLKDQLYGAADNTAQKCLAACAAKGYAYCGTQYHRECWGGPTPPAIQVGDLSCGFECSGDLDQYCGGDGLGATAGTPHISLFATNATLPPTTNPGGPFVNPGLNGYESIGCYTESTTGRALPNAVSTNDIRTVAACINACAPLNYKYVGLEYGGECWCANEFRAGAVPTAISECSMTCRENGTEYCGAGQRLNVYQRSGTGSPSSSVTGTSSTVTGVSTSVSTTVIPSSTAPAIKQTVGLYRYQGCYTETTLGGRSLGGKTYTDDLMTLEACAAACSGFTYLGLEYGRECYCGNELRGNTAPDVNQGACTFLCPGDKTTFCGAGSRLSLYKFDPSLASTSSSTIVVTTSSSTSTSSVESSTSSELPSTTSTSSEITSTSSELPSTTSTSSEVTSTSSELPSTTSTTSEESTTSSELPSTTSTSSEESTTTTSSEITSTSSEPPSTMSTSSEESTTSSELPTTTSTSSELTSTSSDLPSSTSTTSSEPPSTTTSSEESTTSTSSEVTSTSSEVPSTTSTTSSEPPSTTSSELSSTTSSELPSTTSTTSSEPPSTTSSEPPSTTSTTSSEPPSTTSSELPSTTSTTSSELPSTTSTTSSAPPSTTSTTSSALPTTTSTTSTSIVSSTSTTSSAPTATIPPPLWPGNVNFTYYGCAAEPSNGRLLTKQVFSSDLMTQDKCLETCWMYKYAGVEYGRECWCGNGPLNWKGNTGATPGFNATDVECNKNCPGDPTRKCGAGKRITLFYSKKTT